MEEDYTTTRGKPKTTATGHNPASNSDLLSSAKLLAAAAKSTLSNDGSKVDKAQIAGATADLLAAVKKSGNFEQQGVGKYIDKAEGYLQQYHSSHSSTTPTQHGGDGKHGHSSSGGSSDGHSGSGGSAGDYIKMAQGFLKNDNQSQGGGGGGGHSGSGGSAGDYIKMAQGFLKKDDQSHGGGGGGHGPSSGDYIKLAQGFLKKH